ncbi:hypothetical protein [Holzapfeliella floricola]|uniref:ABC transporter permease n=1 Tax=Holzapfeliella floricola DSM 23037 = JCM 16512 TaxID=1423744 RepID=A0A0R2DKF6_9LACO|nr:hypothetical protein [Holzapfeliella floricola]KRN04607.1 hypothetical protein FC86_GL000055 [Holzapfeliella floricola DSM 23037 = JCM 16512]
MKGLIMQSKKLKQRLKDRFDNSSFATPYFSIRKLISVTVGLMLLIGLATSLLIAGKQMARTTESNLANIYYDGVVYSTSPQVDQQVKQLNLKDPSFYAYKVHNGTLFVSIDELNNFPLKLSNGQKMSPLTLNHLPNSVTTYLEQLFQGIVPFNQVQAVTELQFQQVPSDAEQLRLLKSEDFTKDFETYQTIDNLQKKQLNLPQNKIISFVKSQKYNQIMTQHRQLKWLSYSLSFIFTIVLSLVVLYQILSYLYQRVYLARKNHVKTPSIRLEMFTGFLLPVALGAGFSFLNFIALGGTSVDLQLFFTSTLTISTCYFALLVFSTFVAKKWSWI